MNMTPRNLRPLFLWINVQHKRLPSLKTNEVDCVNHKKNKKKRDKILNEKKKSEKEKEI